MSTFFAGLDWASQTHAVCVLDEHGTVRERIEVEHNAVGLASLVRQLRRYGNPPVAIERPSGLIVDTLVASGLPVVPIHPNVVKATRPRYRSHGAKSDASDALLLADLLRTDGHRFRLARSLARTLLPLVEQIRQLSSRIEHHVASLDDGRILMSFPRAGRICAAQILAELGSVRERFDNNSRHAHAWAASVYAKARARGCDHPHAVRILARAWLRVIWRAWVDRQPYDPARHRGAQLLIAAAEG